MNIYLALLIINGAFLTGIACGMLLVAWLKSRHDFIEKYYPEADDQE